MDSDTIKTAPKRILIVAEHRIGHGSGHLHRCARIVPKLNGHVDWFLPLEGDADYYGRSEALEIIANPDLPVRWVDAPEGPYDIVILDRREITLAELRQLNVSGIVIGIDLAGEGRSYCSYLIDALESPPGTERPNIADSGLLQLPDNVRPEWPKQVNRILVAFGGEQSGAGSDLAAQIAEQTGLDVYLAARKAVQAPKNVRLLESKGALQEALAEFDLVLTHFGLTAYEALWARVPVILRNPGRYHSALSRSAGFTEIRTAADVKRHTTDVASLVERCRRIRPKGTSDIASLINELNVPARLNPPVGGDRWQPAVYRFAERTFFRNSENGLIYMQNYRGNGVTYTHDYFFSEYARQYGKTYLEDFPAIKAAGMRRMDDILRMVKQTDTTRPPRLLDIGCAFGPFLQAAAETGCDVSGIDISSEAVDYVQNTLGFPARCIDVLGVDAKDLNGPYDIITMWYVIEHFQDLDRLLHRVVSNLKPGGLFAFSTPNLAGISGRQDRREFFRLSPSDHFTVMSPSTAAAVLRKFNLHKKKVRITGHHPERFDFVPPGRDDQRTGARYPGFRHWLAGTLSRVAGLGDTFEMVAEYRP
ncbi:MAG: methyltransferase domain-containing protein [Alkalispirochaeta sp.]